MKCGPWHIDDQRGSTSEGEAASVANAKLPVAECHIELLQRRGIITNEFKTEVSAAE